MTAKRTAKQSSQSINQSNKQTNNQSINQSNEPKTKKQRTAPAQSTKQTNQSINQSIKQTNKQSNKNGHNQSINQSTKKSTNQPTNQSINQSALKLDSNQWSVESTDCLDIVRPVSKKSKLPIISINQSMKNDELDSDSTLIDSLIYPIKKSTFLNHSFAKRVLAIQGGGSARVDRLIDSLGNLDPQYLMTESPSESIFVWMRQSINQSNNQSTNQSTNQSDKQSTNQSNNQSVNQSINQSGYQTMKSFAFANPEQIDAALACYESGNSLYFRAPTDASRCLVRSLTAGLGINFAGIFDSDSAEKGEVETFLSRAGHVTDWHTDFQQNFTIQLQGSKTWHFASSSLVHPLRGATPHYETQSTLETQQKAHSLCDPLFTSSSRPSAGGSASSVTLQKGDVMFHPAGVWHRVECMEDSISINVSLIGDTYADLVSDACRQLLWKTEARTIVHGEREDIQKGLKSTISALQSILNSIRPSDIVPVSRFIPRTKRIILDSERASEYEKDGKMLLGTFRRNPLFVAIELTGEQPESEDDDEDDEFSFDDSDEDNNQSINESDDSQNEENDEDNNQSINESDDSQNEENDEDDDSEEANGENDGENDSGDEDSENGEDQESSMNQSINQSITRFALHHGFGNEDLQSSVRIAIHADELSTSCMRVLGWTEKDLHADAQFEKLKNPQLKGAFISTLAALVEIGFFTLI